MAKIKIVAAVLDTTQLTLYREDGTPVVIKQGDPRVQRIIDEATISLSTQGWAEIELGHETEQSNDYREFQKQTSGAVKFFRVAKSWLKGVFTGGEIEQNDGSYGRHHYIEPVSLGTVPVQNVVELTGDMRVEGELVPAKPTMKEATAQIMAQAQPVTDPKFSTLDTVEEHTMIAEITHPETGETQIIPGMEHLQVQFQAAAKLGSTQGVTNFLRRIAAIIEQRGHTIDELLRFMSKGDLPIADDGSIIAYKVLQSRDGGRFVDVHSKKVSQAVGSHVSQANVDPNRRVECSTGLHIARRGYLRNFSGDIIVLVKIAPEDVIAVPLREPDKMRAQAYHILSTIPKDDHNLLRCGKPLASKQAKKLLSMAISGDHIGIIERVVIGGPSGTNVTITKVEDIDRRQPKMTAQTPVAEPIEIEKPKETTGAPVVNPLVVSKKSLGHKMTNQEVAKQEEAVSAIAPVVEAVSEKDEPVSSTVPEYRRLFNEDKYAELIALRKSKKKSWAAWGFSAAEIMRIESPVPAADQRPQPNAHLKATAEAGQRLAEREETLAETADYVLRAAGVHKTAMPVNETRGEKAQRLFRQKNWSDLYAHKKSVKVGWEKLGFSGQQIEQIVKNQPK